MRLGPIDAPGPTLAAVALALVVGAVVVVGATTSGAAFGSHNPGWEGLSEVREEADDAGAETILATDVQRYGEVEANGTVALVIAPEEYDAGERAQLRAFVEDGGTLVLATRDAETANPLFEELGADVRVDGDPLRDEREHGPSPAFPRVATVADHPYVRSANGMELNHGTALVAEGDAAPIANSSEFSYLDRDRDGEPSQGEVLAARPVVAVEDVGDGEVVAVSDPSVFINAMLERDGNRAFVAGLLGEHDRLLLDRSHGDVPPLVLALAAIRESTALGVAVAVALLGGVLAWDRGVHRRVGALAGGRSGRDDPGDGHTGADRDAIASHLAERQPDWDPDRGERVLGGVIRAGDEPTADERSD